MASEPHRVPASTPATDILALDAHTLQDLEIFGTPDAPGLFEYCNRTRTDGGARALRQRMTRPWSNPLRIEATQRALAFILARRDAFAALQGLAYSAARTEHYLREILPIVTGRNRVEFTLGAIALWANHDNHYNSIARGVLFSCRFVAGLRRFVAEVGDAAGLGPGDPAGFEPGHDSVDDPSQIDDGSSRGSPAGELTATIRRMRALLGAPSFAGVPDTDPGGFALRVLRLDQHFRTDLRDALTRLVELLHDIDALAAMADVTGSDGHVVPELTTGGLRVDADDVRHPFLADAVPNPVALDQSARVLFLTGPNMAGKTTYLRAFATALYLAHLGMGVPARRFSFVPADCLFSSIALGDDLRSGVSYFRAEALRVRAVAEAIADGRRVVAVMDEPFKGTNVRDAFDASLAILSRLATCDGCLFMFSSHLIELSERIAGRGQVRCCCFDADEREDRLRFDYRLREGVSGQRLGMRVLREEGIFELLPAASEPGPG